MFALGLVAPPDGDEPNAAGLAAAATQPATQPAGITPPASETPPTENAASDTSPNLSAWQQSFRSQGGKRDGGIAPDDFTGTAKFAAVDKTKDGRIDDTEFKNHWIIQSYGLWVIAPAIIAILIAIFTRQVLVALPLGILTASAMMMSLDGVYNPIAWVTHALDAYFFNILAFVNEKGELKNDKLWIIVFTLFIGAMVGVIDANGGTRAMVGRVIRHMRTRERGQLGAWVAGLLVFFDDYANAMIVGPSMRPVFDRLKISREKLAYIVDSTAAPVSSVFIGTWLVAEIGFIQDGLTELGADCPAFLANMTGSTAFWASLPYRTYAWLALAMVCWVAWTGRDFGAMRKAEARAAARPDTEPTDVEPTHVEPQITPERKGPSWWLGAAPVAFLVLMVVVLLFDSGRTACLKKGISLNFGSIAEIPAAIKDVLSYAQASAALLYASLAAALLAIGLTLVSRRLSLGKTMDAALAGMTRMFPACVVLVLAWGLSRGMGDVQLGEVAHGELQLLIDQGLFSAAFMPLVTFIAAAFVSFATGTSWGTMGILCPAVVSIGARLFGGLPEDQALVLFYATIGAVLTGAVFGDHCSPISDTTVLSSIASECDLGKHVWTQMPYALVVAGVGILCTDLLSAGLDRWAGEFLQTYRGWVIYLGTATGMLLLLLIVRTVGRRPAQSIPQLHTPV